MATGLEDYVVPRPLDSTNASELLRYLGITVDVLHLDAGHTYGAVTNDLVRWWPSLRQGGLFVDDDYHVWSDTRRAIDDFLAKTSHKNFQASVNKCAAFKIEAMRRLVVAGSISRYNAAALGFGGPK